ncbi:MAG TPA: type IV secretion system protein [Bryobacteraceae bacterium]|nr:type IV secretion system protein [Bryobacteraceae bacterium]
MPSTHLLPRPKSYEDAASRFAEALVQPRITNSYLRVALVCSLMLSLGLLALNFRTHSQQREKLVVRIDDIGRAQAMGFSTLEYKPQPPEIKYFLRQFVHDYYGRDRTTARDDFQRSMSFLSTSLSNARMQEERRTKSLEHYLLGDGDDVQIQIDNIVLTDLRKAPYVAQIDIDKIYRMRDGSELRREKYVVSATFSFTNDVPNSVIPMNPLGLMITYLREDQAF